MQPVQDYISGDPTYTPGAVVAFTCIDCVDVRWNCYPEAPDPCFVCSNPGMPQWKYSELKLAEALERSNL